MSGTGLADKAKEVGPPQAFKHGKVNFLDKKRPEVDVDEWLEQAKLTTDLEKRRSGSQDEATVWVKSDGPIANIFSADWHLGALGCDYAAFHEHVQFVREEPRFYLTCLGDEADNSIGFNVVAARNQIWTKHTQEDVFRALLDEFLEQNKILCGGFDNHTTERDDRMGGSSYFTRIKQERVPYFQGIGMLHLKVGPTEKKARTYHIAVVHKTRFGSFMRACHGNKRMQQQHMHLFGLDAPQAQVIATAHTHNPAFEWEESADGHYVWLVKAGTFNTGDVYSKRYFGKGRIGLPTLVLWPDNEHEPLCVPHPRYAKPFLGGVDG